MNSIRVGLFLALVAPSVGRAQSLTAAERTAIEDTIRSRAEVFAGSIGPGKLNAFLELFTPDRDFIYVDGGRIYPDRDALGKAASGFFGSLKTGGGTWGTQRVIALSPTAGAFTGVFRSQISDTTGRAVWTDGKIWTLIYQRRAGKWVIVQAHEATVPPRS